MIILIHQIVYFSCRRVTDVFANVKHSAIYPINHSFQQNVFNFYETRSSFHLGCAGFILGIMWDFLSKTASNINMVK